MEDPKIQHDDAYHRRTQANHSHSKIDEVGKDNQKLLMEQGCSYIELRGTLVEWRCTTSTRVDTGFGVLIIFPGTSTFGSLLTEDSKLLKVH
jgi:hypothetical protein